MTAPAKDKPSVSVATRPTSEAEAALAELERAVSPQQKASIYLLADALKQSKMVRSIRALVAATEWGGAMSEARQIAFSRYLLALGGDPLRHVDLLGGSPFVNGDYFRDVIAANPEFRWASDPLWIHDDPRLQLCVACAKPFDGKPDHGHGIDSVTQANTDRLEERVKRAGLRVLHAAD